MVPRAVRDTELGLGLPKSAGERGGPRLITGCARRSPIEVSKDPGSTPGTSTTSSLFEPRPNASWPGFVVLALRTSEFKLVEA